MLTGEKYFNLVIARKAIHEGKNNTSSTVVDNMIDVRGIIVVFGKNIIHIPKINEKYNSSLFLHERINIRYPFSQWHGLDKTNLQTIFNLGFDGCIF